MGDTMRLLGLLIMGLVLGGPTAARAQMRISLGKSAAQTVKPADLVGQWAKQGEKTPTLTIRADSTLVWVGKITLTTPDGQQSKGDLLARWHLAGDTLVTTAAGAKGELVVGFVKLEGAVLTVSGPAKDAKPQVYERLGTAKP
jgi:hypothetical protein